MIAPVSLYTFGDHIRGLGKQHFMLYDPEPTPDQIKQMFNRSELLSGTGCTEWVAHLLDTMFEFELRRLHWYDPEAVPRSSAPGVPVWGLLNEEGDYVMLFPGIVTPHFAEHHLYHSELDKAYDLQCSTPAVPQNVD
jgi:hypothetical protein